MFTTSPLALFNAKALGKMFKNKISQHITHQGYTKKISRNCKIPDKILSLTKSCQGVIC